MDNCGFMDELKQLIKSFLGILLIVAVSFLIGHRVGRRTASNGSEPTIIERVDSITVIDTIVREKPVFRYSYIHDTVRLFPIKISPPVPSCSFPFTFTDSHYITMAYSVLSFDFRYVGKYSNRLTVLI